MYSQLVQAKHYRISAEAQAPVPPVDDGTQGSDWPAEAQKGFWEKWGKRPRGRNPDQAAYFLPKRPGGPS